MPDLNLPVWAYYSKGFIDPLYLPYQKTKVVANNPNDPRGPTSCQIEVFPAKSNGSPLSFNQEEVRKGKFLNFQRQYTTDPCPPNYSKGKGNWCIQDDPEYEPIFYTDKAFLPVKRFNPPASVYKGRPDRSNYGYTVDYSPYKNANVSNSYL